MKKLLVSMLVVLLMFSIVACGGQKTTDEPAEQPAPAEEPATPAEEEPADGEASAAPIKTAEELANALGEKGDEMKQSPYWDSVLKNWPAKRLADQLEKDGTYTIPEDVKSRIVE